MPVDQERATAKDYQILGVSSATPYSDIKKEYRTLVKLWHPDRFQLRPESERLGAEEKLKEITGAYHRVAREHVLRERIRLAAEATLKDADRAERERAAHRPTPAEEASRRPTPSVAPRRRVRRFRFVWISASSLGLLLLLVIAIPLAWMPYISMLGDAGPERDLASVKRFWESPPPESPTVPESSPRAPVDKRGKPELPALDSAGLLGGALPGTFTIGSSQSEVYRVQGAPSRIHGQTWVYGLSEVQFRDGRVTRYDNFDGSLQVSMPTRGESSPESPEFFSLGSSQDEVLLVQGTPTRVDGGRWYFGFSLVRFKDGKVDEFDNHFGNLKVRVTPSAEFGETRADYFTIGSSRDQVIAVQGTPTKVQGGLWFYRFSNVQFRDGKVAQVVNSDGSLRFQPPNESFRSDDRS